MRVYSALPAPARRRSGRPLNAPSLGRMKRALVIIVLLVIPVGAAAAWWAFTAQYVYRHVAAPDGSWQVTVLRQRVPPYIGAVSVIVRAIDASGELLHEQRIDNRDLWLEVEERYPVVEMDNAHFRAGPRWWNGQESTFFILNKSELARAA